MDTACLCFFSAKHVNTFDLDSASLVLLKWYHVTKFCVGPLTSGSLSDDEMFLSGKCKYRDCSHLTGRDVLPEA